MTFYQPNRPGGQFQQPECRRRLVRQPPTSHGYPWRGAPETADDIESIVVAESKGVPVFAQDVGRVKIGAGPPPAFLG